MKYNNNALVYGLISPENNDCVYVGCTKDMERRSRDHRNKPYIFKPLMWFETKNEANNYERILIARLKIYGQAQLNVNAKALSYRGKRYTKAKRK